jgi:hypothetical protein
MAEGGPWNLDRMVDVNLAGGLLTALTVKSPTSMVPIVFASVSGPIAAGQLASLAQRATPSPASAFSMSRLTPKRIDTPVRAGAHAKNYSPVHEPEQSRDGGSSSETCMERRPQRSQLPIVKAGGESEINAAFGVLVRLEAGALVIGADPSFGIR